MPIPTRGFGILEGANGGFEYKSEIIKGLCYKCRSTVGLHKYFLSKWMDSDIPVMGVQDDWGHPGKVLEEPVGTAGGWEAQVDEEEEKKEESVR